MTVHDITSPNALRRIARETPGSNEDRFIDFVYRGGYGCINIGKTAASAAACIERAIPHLDPLINARVKALTGERK